MLKLGKICYLRGNNINQPSNYFIMIRQHSQHPLLCIHYRYYFNGLRYVRDLLEYYLKSYIFFSIGVLLIPHCPVVSFSPPNTGFPPFSPSLFPFWNDNSSFLLDPSFFIIIIVVVVVWMFLFFLSEGTRNKESAFVAPAAFFSSLAVSSRFVVVGISNFYSYFFFFVITICF